MCIANGDGVVAGVMVVINEHFRKREKGGCSGLREEQQ